MKTYDMRQLDSGWHVLRVRCEEVWLDDGTPLIVRRGFTVASPTPQALARFLPDNGAWA